MVCSDLVLCGGLVVHNVCWVGSIFVVLNHSRNLGLHLICFVNKLENLIWPYAGSKMKKQWFITTLATTVNY
jgi:hypothetical protein